MTARERRPRRLRGPWRVAVVDGSMRPAIEPGDWLLVDPTVGRWPRRGIVVVFREPMTDELAIKRVAGRPGDRVPFAGGWLRMGDDEAWLLGDASDEELARGRRAARSTRAGTGRSRSIAGRAGLVPLRAAAAVRADRGRAAGRGSCWSAAFDRAGPPPTAHTGRARWMPGGLAERWSAFGGRRRRLKRRVSPLGERARGLAELIPPPGNPRRTGLALDVGAQRSGTRPGGRAHLGVARRACPPAPGRGSLPRGRRCTARAGAWPGRGRSPRSAGAVAVDRLQDLGGTDVHEVELVGEPRGQPQRPFAAVAADDDRDRAAAGGPSAR